MDVVAIDRSNVEQHLDAVVALYDEFLDQLNINRERSIDERTEIVRRMVESVPTRLLLALNEDKIPIGISYYNYGFGYACGGTYLWLNCIYVRPDHRHRGYASRLLDYIEGDGRNHGIRLFLTCRDNDNAASQKLFERNGFDQESQTMMSKRYRV